MNMDFTPKHVTVITKDKAIMRFSMVSPQSSAGSVKNIWRGHVGLHWAPIQLSVSLMEVWGDLTHATIKSLILALLAPVTICVDSQVPLCILFLLERKVRIVVIVINNETYASRHYRTQLKSLLIRPDSWAGTSLLPDPLQRELLKWSLKSSHEL